MSGWHRAWWCPGNATGVGHRNTDGTVTQTVIFQRFCAQYGFEARFRDPYPGNEKGSAENAVEWRSVKADRTGTVPVGSNRYLAGPKWHSMRLQAGAGSPRVELRDPDGGRTATLERVWGRSPDIQADPAALLAVIARKPRPWGESPIRGDSPEPVRDLPGRMDAPERSSLISDIRHAGETYGFPAAAGAVAAIIKAGRTVDRATIETAAVPTAQINLTKYSWLLSTPVNSESRIPLHERESLMRHIHHYTHCLRP
ncbi:hypothetical protein I6E06_01775 [Bifidobacterium boum]|nr:hypothetical protein [Bifidobacterium boum]